MIHSQIAEKINNLSEEKAARVMGYIQTLEFDEEPALTDDEETGIRTANAELARGEGRSFKEAMKALKYVDSRGGVYRK